MSPLGKLRFPDRKVSIWQSGNARHTGVRQRGEENPTPPAELTSWGRSPVWPILVQGAGRSAVDAEIVELSLMKS